METPEEMETPGQSETSGERETPGQNGPYIVVPEIEIIVDVPFPGEMETPGERETPGQGETPGERKTPVNRGTPRAVAAVDIIIDTGQESSARAQWGHQLELLLTCVGLSVGLGNVWRFPYLCYKNGGAAFLVAYLILQMTIGKPMYFMEMALGQYSGKGPVRVWDFCPPARGVGMVMCAMCVIICVYYNVLMAYILYYLGVSFQAQLPWSYCRPHWKNCITNRILLANITVCKLGSRKESNCTCTGDVTIDRNLGFQCGPKLRTPSDIYFYDEVIMQGNSLSPEDMGAPLLHLSLTLLLAWIIVLACVIKGVKSTGKVVYFTATFPYLVLLILLIRSATLSGSGTGVKFFVIPKWSELGRLQLWLDALGQMFFSLGLSSGAIISASSYSYFHGDIYRDSLIISMMDLLTSLIAGFVIFMTFGHISETTGVKISDLASSGYGLAFVAYPEALATLPVPQLWSIMFFLMLITLGLDSEFALFETVLTYLEDDFRVLRRNRRNLRIGIGAACFLLGLAFVSPGGIYLIEIFDTYGVSYCLIGVSALEVVSVGWSYGMGKFVNDMEYMLGRKPPFLPFWYFTLAVWSPLVLAFMTIMTLSMSATPKYVTGEYYGPLTMFACWAMYTVVMLPIPFWFFLHIRIVYKTHGFQNLRYFLDKILEPSKRWGPADGSHRAASKRVCTIWADVFPSLVVPASPAPCLGSPATTLEYVFMSQRICEYEVIVPDSKRGSSAVDEEASSAVDDPNLPPSTSQDLTTSEQT